MSKLQIRKAVLVLGLAASMVLSGCRDKGGAVSSKTDVPLIGEWRVDYSPISEQRTGIARQGIFTPQNGFECTDTGVYFMCSGDSVGEYLFYADHDSDTLVKLCGRPDCEHSGNDCNAFLIGEATFVFTTAISMQ